MLLIELANSVNELAGAIKELRDSQSEIMGRLDSLEQQLKQNRAAAKGQTRTGYAQFEDLLALYRDIDPGQSLPRMRNWAAGPELLRFLYEEIMERRRTGVLECGSGTTTVVMAYAMRSLGSGKVTALEHNPHYAALTRHELSERGLTEWAEVADAELSDVVIDGQAWRWYDVEAIPSGEIDMLLVDGPPGDTGPQARYPALPLLADRLSESALVVLDDANRADERAIVQRWTEQFPQFESQRLRHERGTVALRRADNGA
ncbi:class I SAM-dependent methyltransferase [Glycomyces arizonensis]|uniref:class I SAM-dependent methyltransferase n=1 Tax=Glycomyces arizonensis TaxID=256035 RepID=UPI0003FA1B26|nr:class I SAM-dependent methyltransferase [Glycomyces arizonensis]